MTSMHKLQLLSKLSSNLSHVRRPFWVNPSQFLDLRNRIHCLSNADASLQIYANFMQIPNLSG